MSDATGIVDTSQQGANMYGCLPCPKCGSEYRWPQKGGPNYAEVIVCDDCGFEEPYRFGRAENE